MADLIYLRTEGGLARPEADYVRHKVTERLPAGDGATIFFNGADRRKLLTVHIVAKTLTFAPAEDGHLLNRYNQMENLEWLIIETRHLVLKEPFYLPGTDVHIYAETVEFIDDDPDNPSSIVTTPLAPSQPIVAADAVRTGKGTLKSAAEDGAAGEDAGDIYLFVKTVLGPEADFQSDDPARRFFMYGGDGHAAGKGVPAGWSNADAKNAGLPSGFNIGNYRSALPKAPKAPSKPKILKKPAKPPKPKFDKKNLKYWGKVLTPVPVKVAIITAEYAEANKKYKAAKKTYNNAKKAHEVKKKHGNEAYVRAFSILKDPVPGGVPGNGGTAGDHAVTLDGLLPLFDRIGGNPGSVTPATKGIAADSYWHKSFRLAAKRANMNAKAQLKRALLPAEVAGPFEGAAGEAGEPQPIDDKGTMPWVTPALLQMQLEMLDDLYLIGDFEQAKLLAGDLWTWSGLEAYDQTADEYGLQVHLARLREVWNRLSANLDFFGNPPGWVPNLSFEVNFNVYQQQAEDELRILLMTQWLERHAADAKSKKQALQRLMDNELSMISDERDAVANVKGFIPEIEQKLETIKQDIATFSDDLAERKDSIKQKFEKDRKFRRNVDAVFNVFDSLLYVLPVKVLAPAAVFRELAYLHLDKPSKIPDDAASNAFRDILDEDDVAEAREELDKLDFVRDEGGTTHFYHEQIATLSDRMSSEIEGAIKQSIGDAINNSADFDAAKKFQDMLEADEDYQFIFDRLLHLLTQRRVYSDELDFARSTLDEAVATIMEATWNVDRIQQALAGEKSIEALEDNLSLMGRRARQRLIQYQYVLAKSFEFRMLEPARVNFQSGRLFDQMQELMSVSAADPDSSNALDDVVNVKDLVVIFTESLQDMTSRILRTLNEDRYAARASQRYAIELSPAQLEILNNDRQVEIDLKKHGVLAASDRDARVLEMVLDAENSKFALPGRPRPGHLPVTEFSIGVSPHAYVRWNDDRIGFYHRTPRSSSILPWNFMWQYPRGIVPNREQQDSGNSFLASLTGSREDARLTFRPSAHGTFALHMEDVPTGTDETVYPLQVSRLTLNVVIQKSKKL